ncbi:rhamnulokinase [Kibdelosporangium banguiense]|uniref:Rhamnulokinase n=1 Tax=Kibdelosporangium banguiense TaxID=1365924 RepID=A0ABS4TPA8_9PSEU|nr:rhamnulokinase family protein [Kibdelosporangium banguiense]MBP2325790.1 rhamnulokinase [Kibdelosporangium banguiense]
MTAFVAVDLGASSGRVMLGQVTAAAVSLTELRRFPTGPRPRPDGGLNWNVTEIHHEILAGLRDAAPANPISIGVDSWAIDYGLIGPSGQLDGDVRSYRDPRTERIPDQVRKLISDEDLYEICGLQHLPFTTIYQLMAEPQDRLADHRMLLLPDLITYWLTGTMGAEVTNASTTGLLDATTRQWSPEIMSRLDLPSSLLPPLRQPGDHCGLFGSTQVVSVASHDTASAVAALPVSSPNFGYISCGTWSLVGLELPAPVLTQEARLANFTNESGVDGTVRFLHNTMGLWLLNESARTWGADLAPLLRAAEDEPALKAVFNPDDTVFLAPGDIPARIVTACRSTGQEPPRRESAFVRSIIESLALGHASALGTAARLANHETEVVHLVGGGARNKLLCQLTADACGIPVLAGPVEASALGNILVQARAAGVEAQASPAFARYEPRGNRDVWREAADRVGLPFS